MTAFFRRVWLQSHYLAIQVFHKDHATNHMIKPMAVSITHLTLGLDNTTDNFAAAKAKLENQMTEPQIAPIKK